MESWQDTQESRKLYERRDGMQEMPRLPEYNLSIESIELVGVLKGIGETVKWPQKMKSASGARDIKKWCKFHRNHGH